MAVATNPHKWAAAERDMAPHVDTLIGYAKDAKTIIEFGVRNGASSWAFLTGLPETGRLWSVDIDEPRGVPAPVRDDPRWVFVRGSDLEDNVIKALPGKADLVLLDTIHTYEQVAAELKVATIKNPSRICVHDYEWEGTKKAVDEFVKNEDWEIEDFFPASDAKGPFGLVTLIPSQKTRTVKPSAAKAKTAETEATE